jgi:hypothetical protein
MTDEKKAQLAAAREKALEKRRMLADLTKKEKEIKNMALKERIENVTKTYDEKTAGGIAHPRLKQEMPKQEMPKPVKKGRKPPPPPPSSSENSESSESEDEAPVVPVRKPKKKPTSAYAADIARDELRKKIERENLNIAYRSLFPHSYTVQF